MAINGLMWIDQKYEFVYENGNKCFNIYDMLLPASSLQMKNLSLIWQYNFEHELLEILWNPYCLKKGLDLMIRTNLMIRTEEEIQCLLTLFFSV